MKLVVRRDTSSRRERIVALLREQNSVQIPELAEAFGVSTQTVRKDLNFLDAKGVCTRSPGGALLRLGPLSPTEEAIDVRRRRRAEEKVRIGKAAAALLHGGESILLDSGTTTLQVARHLPAQALVVVTNDVGIMNELAAREAVQLVFLGGTLRRRNLSFYGTQTERALEGLHVDKLFLAADGFDVVKGVTTHYEPEALLNRLMCQAAREIVVVTDSSKFGRVCLHKIVDTRAITRLVTDAGIGEATRAELTRSGVEVIVA